MPPVVRTAGLTKEFRGGFRRRTIRRAVDDLSLEIPSGRIVGLLGPNGAGKSTTLKLLLDLLRPTAGTVELLGHSPGDARVRRRVGFLPEQPAFDDHLSGEELLAYFAGLAEKGQAATRRRVQAVLDRVGLDEARRRPIRQYSTGMVQRLGLAQAIVHDPEVVILDEPMSGLDPLGRRDVRDLILGWRDEGRTVLFSSHILSDAERLCSDVAILSNGRLAAGGPIESLTSGSRRGWEIVLADVSAVAADDLGCGGGRVSRIAPGRYRVEIGMDRRPETVVRDLTTTGARLMSVTPLERTLEDVFFAATRHDSAGVGTERPS